MQKVEIDRQRAELQRGLAQMNGLQRELARLDEERRQEQERLSQLRDGVLDMQELLAHQRYLNALQRREQEQLKELVAQRRQVAALQAEVVKARRRHRAVERLDERRREQHTEVVQRAERLELDEASRALAGARVRSQSMKDDHAE
ncbi:MAG: flagellar export protein FliJ [Planctomycetota bacterium]